MQLQQRAPKGFSQTLPAAADQPVKVSLHDCLACSGCVTSAETVLLQHQSTGELLQRLADGTWTVVVSLSPQSVAALAALHGLSAADCAARLATFLRRLGARAVFDIAAARQLALAEAAAEFVQRYRTSARGAAALAAAGAAGVAAAAGSDAMDIDSGPAAAVGSSAPSGSSGGSGGQPLPMLASACPGWVCYAEKTHGDHVLPYIATGGCFERRVAAAGSLSRAAPALQMLAVQQPCFLRALALCLRLTSQLAAAAAAISQPIARPPSPPFSIYQQARARRR